MDVKLVKIARSDRWYATWTVNGRSHRVSTKTRDRSAALTIAREIQASFVAEEMSPAVVERGSTRAMARAMLSRLCTVAKRGQRRRQVRLTEEQLFNILQRSQGRCAVSGIPFSMKNVSGCWRNPWAPSVDRIDSSRPYRPNNIRIVCVAVNTALSDWGSGVLLRMAESIAQKHRLRAKYAQTEPKHDTSGMG